MRKVEPSMGVDTPWGAIISAIPKVLDFMGSGDRAAEAQAAAERAQTQRYMWIFAGGMIAVGLVTAVLVTRSRNS